MKRLFEYYESLPSSAQGFCFILFIFGIIVAIILGFAALIPDHHYGEKQPYEIYQTCVENNMILEKNWIDGKYTQAEFKAYDCSELLKD